MALVPFSVSFVSFPSDSVESALSKEIDCVLFLAVSKFFSGRSFTDVGIPSDIAESLIVLVEIA